MQSESEQPSPMRQDESSLELALQVWESEGGVVREPVFLCGGCGIPDRFWEIPQGPNQEPRRVCGYCEGEHFWG
jgi:hypothetical protein